MRAREAAPSGATAPLQAISYLCNMVCTESAGTHPLNDQCTHLVCALGPPKEQSWRRLPVESSPPVLPGARLTRRLWAPQTGSVPRLDLDLNNFRPGAGSTVVVLERAQVVQAAALKLELCSKSNGIVALQRQTARNRVFRTAAAKTAT